MQSALNEMLRQIRGFTLELLQIDNREMFLWAPPGTSNHMIWHAGHVLWVQDALCIEPLTSKSELPDGWGKCFGQNCDPVSTQLDWPEREQILQLLTKQQDRMVGLFNDMSKDQLVIDAADANDLVGGIIHGLHDEARHHGEMYLLFKQFNAAMDTQQDATNGQA